MTKKLLVFTNETSGQKERVYWVNGFCRNSNTLEKVLSGGYSWASIKTTGNFQPAPFRRKKNRYKTKIEVPEQFLGLQIAPKQIVLEKLDSEGNVQPKRVKFMVTPELIKQMQELAEQGKTLIESAEFLKIAYPIISKTAKSEGIVFVRGKRGTGRKAQPIDQSLLDNMRKEAQNGLTLKETEKTLNVPYAKLSVLAKKNGIVFKAGVKGRKGTGEVKSIDPETVKKIKDCSEKGLTVSETTKQLGLVWYEVINIAKKEGIVFVKGKRGRQAKQE